MRIFILSSGDKYEKYANFTQRDLVGLSAQDFENLQNEMLSLMSTNPEFSDALAELVDLSENYEAQREALFGDEQ